MNEIDAQVFRFKGWKKNDKCYFTCKKVMFKWENDFMKHIDLQKRIIKLEKEQEV